MMKTSDYSNWQMFSLIALRVLIGWHFLYEGMIKLINPYWSSMSFLANAQGPFAMIFKNMAASNTMLRYIDILNEWGLVIIGLSLMTGLLSRWGCIAGMALLFMYYISNPPFIGITDTSVSEGNYLIVNKNLIELFALLVLLLFPTSHIFGLDRFFRRV